MSLLLKRRRAFFLLEVMIATLLTGMFAYVSLHGLYHVMNQQQQMLEEIEYSRLVDLKRMDLIAACWNQVETLGKKNKEYSVGALKTQIGARCATLNDNQIYVVACRKHVGDTYYLLSLTEIRSKKFKSSLKKPKVTYHYFIEKENAAHSLQQQRH